VQCGRRSSTRRRRKAAAASRGTSFAAPQLASTDAG
jgi:hypothetical protein